MGVFPDLRLVLSDPVRLALLGGYDRCFLHFDELKANLEVQRKLDVVLGHSLIEPQDGRPQRFSILSKENTRVALAHHADGKNVFGFDFTSLEQGPADLREGNS